MPAVVVPRIIRPFSSSPQQQQQKPTVPPFQHAAGTRAPAYMNFLDEVPVSQSDKLCLSDSSRSISFARYTQSYALLPRMARAHATLSPRHQICQEPRCPQAQTLPLERRKRDRSHAHILPLTRSDHEGAAWGHIMAQALSKGRDAEHKLPCVPWSLDA
eukprot:3528071-Rhodomonas_salina.2